MPPEWGTGPFVKHRAVGPTWARPSAAEGFEGRLKEFRRRWARYRRARGFTPERPGWRRTIW